MPLAELQELVLRLGVAAVLGGLLGLQREMHGRPAGLRTHLLVSLGAATFTHLSPVLAAMSPTGPADAGRVAAQVVTGIGFLGAGAIIKEGLSVRGLTTAASLWIAAAIGATSGASQWYAAALTTALALATLLLLGMGEVHVPRRTYHLVRLTVPLTVGADAVLAAARASGLRVTRCDQDRDRTTGRAVVTLEVSLFHRGPAAARTERFVAELETAGIAPDRVVWSTL